MWLIYKLLAILVIFKNVSVLSENFQCNESFVEPSSKNCKNYITCENGVKMEKSCENSRFFDSERLICDYDRIVCGENSQIIFESNFTVECPESGLALLRDPIDCQKYYVCFFGVGTAKECEADLYFNEEIQSCDLKENVVCNIRCPAKDVPGQPIFSYDPLQEDCKKFYYCLDGNLTEGQCRDGLYFDKNKFCTYPKMSECKVKKADCSSSPNGTISHFSNCKAYYKCQDGYPLFKNCPEGYYFNNISKMCEEDFGECDESLTTILTNPTTTEGPTTTNDPLTSTTIGATESSELTTEETRPTTEETEPTTEEIDPTTEETEPTTEETESSTEETVPITEETKPTTEETESTTEETEQTTEETEPTTEETEPTTEETKPTTEETTPESTETEPITEETGPTTEETKPATEETELTTEETKPTTEETTLESTETEPTTEETEPTTEETEPTTEEPTTENTESTTAETEFTTLEPTTENTESTTEETELTTQENTPESTEPTTKSTETTSTTESIETTTTNPLDICKTVQIGIYKHPDNCYQFISCRFGRGSIEECPKKQIFDADQLKCVFGNRETCLPA